MPHSLTIRADVSKDGRISKPKAARLRAQLALYAEGEVEITIRKPKRSTQANSYYWGVVLDTVAGACAEAGMLVTDQGTGSMRPVTVDDLHKLFKQRYLGVRTLEIDGEPITEEASTAALDSTQFFDYVESIRYDPLVLALGVEVPDPDPSYRSYKIAEAA